MLTDVFRYSDDGRIIYNTSLEELLFLGGTPIIPDTISSDKRVLLLGGITEQYFDLNSNLEQMIVITLIQELTDFLKG